jgi:succinate dehydrogenase/fumarate reductase flavoprotein subunit
MDHDYLISERISVMSLPNSVDVIVIGSGAAGLSCAVTAAHHNLSTLVIEKTGLIGGTSAWSGGWLWAPRNPLARRDGNMEPISAPMEYLRSEIGNRANDPRIASFLVNAPGMVEFFQENTHVEWISGTNIPDFHQSIGAADGARSVCPAPYDGRKLGPWLEKLRPPLDILSLAGMGISAGADLQHFFNATTKLRSFLYVARRLGRHMHDVMRYGRGTQLRNGNALVARLLKSALDKGVNIMTDLSIDGIMSDDHRVTGVIIGTHSIRANCAVVLATGGFPHGKVLQSIYFDHGGQHYSAAPRDNIGDGIKLGQHVGGQMETGFVNSGAWAPVSLVPQENGKVGHYPHLIDRGKPGIIAVGPDGKRFVNEANSYHDFMSALFATYPSERHSAWIIADASALRRYGLGWVKPFPFPHNHALKIGYLKHGQTVQDLAKRCNLPGPALTDTIARWNDHAKDGHDPDFGRGASAYNRMMGDPDHRPNPSLRPLAHGPFYAVQIHPGSLGTFAGLQTNENAQVIKSDGAEISGLYAIGNDMASIFGGNYPSGGITLGPAMTFGYIAARHIAQTKDNLK